jgi:hypothetical protein
MGNRMIQAMLLNAEVFGISIMVMVVPAQNGHLKICVDKKYKIIIV